MFDKKMYEKCDKPGKDLFEEFCEQRGIKVVFREPPKGQLYEHGDFLIDLGKRAKAVGQLSSSVTTDAEMRGAETGSPWREDNYLGHPHKYKYISVHVEERKAKNTSILFQVSFDFYTPNAIVELMRDANDEKRWVDVWTKKRGWEKMADIPIDLCLVLHRPLGGIWKVCPRCNSNEERSSSQKLLLKLLWPEGIA